MLILLILSNLIQPVLQCIEGSGWYWFLLKDRLQFAQAQPQPLPPATCAPVVLKLPLQPRVVCQELGPVFNAKEWSIMTYQHFSIIIGCVSLVQLTESSRVCKVKWSMQRKNRWDWTRVEIIQSSYWKNEYGRREFFSMQRSSCTTTSPISNGGGLRCEPVTIPHRR